MHSARAFSLYHLWLKDLQYHSGHYQFVMPPKAKWRSSWAMAREALRLAAPLGPQTAAGLWEWPMAVVKGLFNSGSEEADCQMRARLQANLARGIAFRTEYSGVDCPREAMAMMMDARRLESEWDYGGKVVFIRSCDKGTTQTRVLKAVASEHFGGAPCHFGDMFERLPEGARAWIDAMTPAKSATKQTKQEAFKSIQDFLREKSAWCFPADATCWCHVHQQECPVRRSRGPSQGPKRKRAGGAGSAAASDAVDGDDTVEQYDDAEEKPWSACVGGVTCHAWSSAGKREGAAHPSEIVHAIFAEERRVMQLDGGEDFAFGECTP